MPPELYQMPSFYPSRKVSKYWWNYPGLQFPACIIISTPDFVVPGMWTNLYAFNCLFLFCLLVSFFSIRYLHIFCLTKPITPLCWYLVVLGYLPALHPIVIYMHLCTLGWMVFLSLPSTSTTHYTAFHSPPMHTTNTRRSLVLFPGPRPAFHRLGTVPYCTATGSWARAWDQG